MFVTSDVEMNAISAVKDWSDNTITLLVEMKKFVKQRLGVLNDEIEKEEEERNAFIIMKLTQRPLQFDFSKFSTPLAKKMCDCFSPQDLEYMQMKIAQILGLI